MAKFVIEAAKTGVKFNLVSGNGEIIATSQVYKTKVTCKKGIESVKTNCAAEVEDQTKEGFEPLKGAKYEIYKDKKGEFRFRLKASNGQIIVAGEGYAAMQGCKNGINSIKKGAPEAEIIDKTKEEVKKAPAKKTAKK